MRLKSLCLATALCVLPATSYALNSAQCRAIEETAFSALDYVLGLDVTQSETSTSRALPDGCVSTDLDFTLGDYGIVLRAEQLSYTGSALTEWSDGDVILPSQLNLRLSGITLRDTPPPYFGWMSNLVGPDYPAQIDLQWTWEEATRGLSDTTAVFDFGGGNSITLEIDGFAPEWEPFALSLENLQVTQFSNVTAFNGLFERAIAAPLTEAGVSMSPIAMIFVAAGIQNIVSATPRSLLPTQSADAIVAFAQSLPEPRGVLSLEASSRVPFDPMVLAEDLIRDLTINAPPPGARFRATWIPSN